MTTKKFIVLTILLALLQLVLSKYCQGLPFLYICILPAMIFCMPTSKPVWFLCLVAFFLGLIADCLADGVPGLNSSALLIVAILQKPVIRLMVDGNLVERGYSFSFYQNGYSKIGAALTVLTLVFFIIYTILDNAGTRPFGFILSKVLISSAASIVFGMFVCSVLCPRIRN